LRVEGRKFKVKDVRFLWILGSVSLVEGSEFRVGVQFTVNALRFVVCGLDGFNFKEHLVASVPALMISGAR
jgi:hypothetical protein